MRHSPSSGVEADLPYPHVQRGYDLIAGTYDEVEARNVVGQRLRRRMQDALFRSFHPPHRVLEIGCGTGIEAVALGQRGIEVVALDLSERMIERLRRKTTELGLPNVTARRLAAHEVGALREEYGDASFDGAYSHAGALNMEPRLSDVAAALAQLVRPRGRFLCTVINQTSLFEVLFYPLVLKPHKAFRRLGNTIPIPITRLEAYRDYVVPSRFYSPAAFYRHFHPHFHWEGLRGLQILLPPWNLADYVERLAPLAQAAEAVENWMARRPPFNAWGYVSLLDMVRTER